MTANETTRQDATLQAALSAVARLFTAGQAGDDCAITAQHVWTKLSQGGGGWARAAHARRTRRRWRRPLCFKTSSSSPTATVRAILILMPLEGASRRK
jgi:hypothetical protein